MNNCKPSEEQHRIAVGGRVLRVTKSVDPVIPNPTGNPDM